MKKTIFCCCALAFGLMAFAQTNLSLLSHYTYPNNVSTSNLTGYADSAGHEYALVGTTQGLSIVNITNPTAPTQITLVPGATGQGAEWREVRTYKGYAYVTTEENSGLVVVNLNYLPDSVQYHTINPNGMHTSHDIFIDENGIAYVNGTDKGQLFLDLNANPWNPTYLGKFTNNYVHDCYVRHDTMWTACINDGILKVIDVHDKTTADDPSHVITQWATPQNFTHNCALSDDNKYIFTTDEKPNSYLTCYDVSDLNNVAETDRAQSDPGSNTIIHNTYFLNNYCITSYYTYGISIFDVTRKNNLVEVAHFDTSPYSGGTFNGAWGVWPYLPSGNIIVSDIEDGLWVLGPTYKRACYLEGTVKDSICQTVLNNVTIQIVNDSVSDITNYLGKYSTGTVDAGTYTIRYTKNGYQTVDVPNVHLVNGALTNINVSMLPISTSHVLIRTVDEQTGNPLPATLVLMQDTSGNTYQEVATDGNGTYNICNLVQGTYNFYAGKWGRKTVLLNHTVTAITDTITLATHAGYYDDFVLNYGWTTNTTASTGAWVRGVPVGTYNNNAVCNPDTDVLSDLGNDCYVTGNNGGDPGDDDVDNGYTILSSPVFDLSLYADPYISYYSWFYNGGGTGNPNDSLIVSLTNGTDSVIIDVVRGVQNQWTFKNFHVGLYITLSANMQIRFKAADVAPGHLVEAGVDVFQVVDSGSTALGVTETALQATDISVYPNPFTNMFDVFVKGNEGGSFAVELWDQLGQKLYMGTPTGSHAHIDTGNGLANGIYILKVLTNGGAQTFTRKLIKVNN